MTTRREHDLLGDRDVPADAYYGVHTLRAVENFPITGTPISIYPDLVARAGLRQAGGGAAPTASSACSTRTRADAIVAACEEIRGGAAARPVRGRRDPGRRRHVDQHERQRGDRQPRARAPRARQRGDYEFLHPNEHVNLSQSHQRRLSDGAQARARYAGIVRLVDAMAVLRRRVRGQGARSSRDVLKMGRTQLQDAVPMTLGQEFSHLRGDARRGRASGWRRPRC